MDSDDPELNDRVRVLQRRIGRSPEPARLAVVVVAVAATIVVTATATIVLFLRGGPAADAPRDVSATAPAERRVTMPTPSAARRVHSRRDTRAPSAAHAAPLHAAPSSPGGSLPPEVDESAVVTQQTLDLGPEARQLVANAIDDVIDGLRATGRHEGIAVFPRPGTNPPKPGVVVPDGYELPEGYVRYHQVTDDGRRLAPILMFSPDYEFVDAQGRPASLPPDRVVPPELAPPNLPVRLLEIPSSPHGAGTRDGSR